MEDIELLRSTLKKVLPYYYRYFDLIEEPAPALDPRIAETIKSKIPALLQKPSGVLAFTSDEREPRKN